MRPLPFFSYIFFLVLLLPLLPPATFGLGSIFGLVIPCVCGGGGLFLFGFLVWVYFWYPFRESVMLAAVTTVGPRPSFARPGAPFLPWGVE